MQTISKGTGMDISSDETSRNSVKEFQEELTTLIDAGAGIIHVRTHEPIRASLEIRKIALADGFTVREWDVVNGFRDFTEDDIGSVVKRGDGNIDAMAAFATPLDHIRDPGHARTRQYYVYVGLHPFMENNPQMHYLVSLYGHILPAWDCPVILVTPDIPLPLDHESIMSVYFRPPGFEELKVSLNSLIEPSRKDFPDGIDVEADGENKICYVGAGLKQSDFEMYTALSIIKAGREGKTAIDTEDIIKGVAIGKTEIVRQSEILELYPSGDMQNVGGLENLKKWVARRRGCYSDEAREFGVEPPKGIVLVGVPGSGKSLIAKSISSELGVPLVRLDFGRVFNSLVGASENRMRQALRQVEDMAPVVLLADEIDKGLGGIGGGGDSGVSSRVLGSFLTWLQDCKKPVFTIVTANNVTGLPPELMRRGRFDAIFSTSLPTYKERYDVLRIHLSLRGRDIEDFDKGDVDTLVKRMEGYVPAEIESAVKDAIVDAFAEEEDLTIAHIESAAKAMVPISKAFEQQINAMNEWAKNNATPAGATDDTHLQSTSTATRVMRRTRRGA